MTTVQVSAKDRDAVFRTAFSGLEKHAQVSASGGVAGGALGALLGAAVGYLAHKTTPEDDDEDMKRRLWKHLIGGASLGALAGTGIGAFKVPDKVYNAMSSALSGGDEITNKKLLGDAGKALDSNWLVRSIVGGSGGNLVGRGIGRVNDMWHRLFPTFLSRLNRRGTADIHVFADRAAEAASRAAGGTGGLHLNPLSQAPGRGDFIRGLAGRSLTASQSGIRDRLTQLFNRYSDVRATMPNPTMTQRADVLADAVRNGVFVNRSEAEIASLAYRATPHTISFHGRPLRTFAADPRAVDELNSVWNQFMRNGEAAGNALKRMAKIENRTDLVSRLFSREGDLRWLGLGATTAIGGGIGALTSSPYSSQNTMRPN